MPGDTEQARRPGGRWRSWRRSRPFWGGLLVTLGAIEILVSVRAPLPVILHVGMQGLAAYLVPVLMLLCGLLLLFNPSQRVFYSILSIMLALVSWLTSNLGGFLIGLLLGLVGGALAFAWSAQAPRPAGQPEVGAADPASDPEPGSGPETETETTPSAATDPEAVPEPTPDPARAPG